MPRTVQTGFFFHIILFRHFTMYMYLRGGRGGSLEVQIWGISLSLPQETEGRPATSLHVTRAATNVRTFEYYSFEIFTNELFLRTNVRWRPLVYFWLPHCGAELRPHAWEPRMHGATPAEILRWRLSCPGPESSSEISKEAVTWTFNLKRSMKDNPSKVSNTF